MRLRRKLRNPWTVAPIAAVLVAVLASSAAAVDPPDLVFFRVGDKSAVIGWGMESADQELPPPPPDETCPEGVDCDFGGYRLWMREVWRQPDPDPLSGSFSLIHEYVRREENEEAAGYWSFRKQFWEEEPVCVEWHSVEPDLCLTWREGVRRDSSEMLQNLQNAFPYEFSVSAFSAADPSAINYEQIHANRTGVVYPRVGTRGNLESVRCIPNPYRAAADWEYGGQRRVVFIGLPERAKIRIYTVAADLVRTLIHEDDESDIEPWDLKNDAGVEVAPGVYIFQVEAEGLGSKDGKVMIIK